MNKRICIKDLIHDFFLIKGHEHLMSNYSVISLYNSNPGLFAIAEKHSSVQHKACGVKIVFFKVFYFFLGNSLNFLRLFLDFS